MTALLSSVVVICSTYQAQCAVKRVHLAIADKPNQDAGLQGVASAPAVLTARWNSGCWGLEFETAAASE